jgi:hypothetical protein
MDHIEFAQAQWLLPVAITLHLVEEIIWLPAWSQRAGSWHPPVGKGEFSFACAVLLVLAYVVTFASVRGGRESLGAYLAAGLAVVMLANVLLPHLGAMIHQRTYAPGVITGVALNLPVTLFLLQQAFADGYISIGRFAVATVLSAIVAAVFWPLLFVLGRRIVGGAARRMISCC